MRNNPSNPNDRGERARPGRDDRFEGNPYYRASERGPERGSEDERESRNFHSTEGEGGPGDQRRWGEPWPDQSRDSDRDYRGGMNGQSTGNRPTRGWEDQGQGRSRGYGGSPGQPHRDVGENQGVGFGGRDSFRGGEQSTGGLGYAGYEEENEYGRGFGMSGPIQRSNGSPGPYHQSVMRKQPHFLNKGPKGYQRSDEKIKELVSEKLSEGYLDASDIEVEVKDGEVTLTGTVSDKNSRRWAEDLADSCAGVKDIENRLKVRREDAGTLNQQSGSKPPKYTS